VQKFFSGDVEAVGAGEEDFAEAICTAIQNATN